MFVNLFPPILGGTERSVANIAEDLRHQGHEVLVLTYGLSPGLDSEPGVLRLGLEEKKLDRLIRHALDSFRPDLIHAHHPFLLGEHAYRESRRRALPLVHTHHTIYHRPEDRETLAPLEQLEKATARLALAYSEQATVAIAPTPSIAELLCTQGLRRELTIIPSGIKGPRFAVKGAPSFRQKHQIPEDSILIGHVGRLVPSKRIPFLARATAQFLSRHPQARALFCGEGEEARCLHETMQAAGVWNRFHLLGKLSDEDLAQAYAAMDLFLFASLSDTQGLVILEAMAAGVPILALRATGPQDLIRDGLEGHLLDPSTDEEGFAKAMAARIGDPSREACARAARQRALEFDRAHCAERLLAAYQQARADKRSRPAFPADETELARRQAAVRDEWKRIRERRLPDSLRHSRGFP